MKTNTFDYQLKQLVYEKECELTSCLELSNVFNKYINNVANEITEKERIGSSIGQYSF